MLVSFANTRLSVTCPTAQFIPVDPDKVVAIVESTRPDNGAALDPPNEDSAVIICSVLHLI